MLFAYILLNLNQIVRKSFMKDKKKKNLHVMERRTDQIGDWHEPIIFYNNRNNDKSKNRFPLSDNNLRSKI